MMLRWLILSLLVVVLDQLSKQLAEASLLVFERVPLLPGFNLTLVYNEGAAFSFVSDQGGWQRWIFVILATVVTLVLMFWLSRLKQSERLIAIALGLIIGGALGNLIDRVLWGHVIDFIDLYYRQWHWPAFNVADSAITLGVVFIFVDALRGQDQVDNP